MLKAKELSSMIENSNILSDGNSTTKILYKFRNDVVIDRDILEACYEYLIGVYGGYIELRPNNSLLVVEYN